MARRDDDAWSQRHSEKSQRSHGGSRRLLPRLGFFLTLSDSARFFGEDFADTRLYRYDGERAVRVAGGAAFPEITTSSSFEANSGDAGTLKKALRFAKDSYPARHTALIFYSHGSGMSFCPDESAGDRLFPSELTRVLSAAESVDLVVFDVCSMAGIENAYQWRPDNGSFSADVMVATPNAGFPFPWPRIFGRIRPGTAPDGERPWLDPRAMTAADLGLLVVEETGAHRLVEIEQHPRMAEMIAGEAMVCMDLARAADARRAVDGLARALATADAEHAGGEMTTKARIEAIRGEGDVRPTMNYFVPGEPSWLSMPYFDLYDLARRIAAEPALSETVRARAAEARDAVDALVLASFGLARYDEQGGFQAGKNGVYLVFPDGDAPFQGRAAWSRFAWYRPDPTGGTGTAAPGDYAFLRDGATRGDGVVDTWFELLEAWYDADEHGHDGVESR